MSRTSKRRPHITDQFCIFCIVETQVSLNLCAHPYFPALWCEYFPCDGFPHSPARYDYPQECDANGEELKKVRIMWLSIDFCEILHLGGGTDSKINELTVPRMWNTTESNSLPKSIVADAKTPNLIPPGYSRPKCKGSCCDLPIGKVKDHHPRLNGNGPWLRAAMANQSQINPNPHISSPIRVPIA